MTVVVRSCVHVVSVSDSAPVFQTLQVLNLISANVIHTS